LGASDFLWQWGQFLDHDIDLTEAQDPEEPASIPVPAGDPWFDPTNSGIATIALNRSVYHHGTGHDPAYPRQQLNQITHFIDASNVYGSDDVRAAAIMGVAILVHLIWVVSVDGDGLFRYRFYVPIVGSVAFLVGLLFYDPGTAPLTRPQRRRAERKGLRTGPSRSAGPTKNAVRASGDRDAPFHRGQT
jgi:hypothetical protein